MFDLEGFLSLLEEMEKKRKRSAELLRWHQMEADNDLLRQASKPRQKPGPKPRAKPVAGSGKPRTGGTPYTGSTPVRSAVDEELRKRRGGGGGGGSAPAPGGVAGSRPGSTSPSFSPAAPASPVVRSAIASGSQPAVVKLVSFAAGQSRIGALLNYQSRSGEVFAEDDAGQRLEGRSWVQDIADEWSEEEGRQPSKDVLRLSIVVPAERFPTDDELGGALKQALAGHRIAWRSEKDGDHTRIELVMSAAARKQPGQGSPSRIFDNRKSLTGLENTIGAAFGDGTHVDVHGFAHGVEGVARYLGQIRKGGRHDLQSVRMEGAGGFVSDVVLSGATAAVAEARDWKRDLRSQERRDVAHIVLSAKPGTSKDGFVAASRAMLAREFAGHRYVFALHEDRDHLHVHAVVKMRAETGERLHPKIQDFKRWRETLAQEARERNIPMDAASRFDRANPPGFKMRDVRRLERGEATESTRRRVERVRNGDVHVPTREEGRRRAELTARAWSDASRMTLADGYKPEAPQRPGIVRLYRAERPGQPASSQPLFTRDRAAAAQIAVRNGGTLRYIEVAADQLHRLTPSRRDPQNIFVVGREMAAAAQVVSPATPAQILHFKERAAIAATASTQKMTITTVSATTGKDSDMADLQVMETSFKEMDASLDAIQSNLPAEKSGEFDKLRNRVKANQRVMLDAQEAIEKKRGKIEGEAYVPPKPVDLQNFVAEKRGEDMRYSHRTADGRAGAVAFTDHGDKVEIGKWNDREVVLAAMQVASEKWGSLSLSGTDRYKALAIELAAEHGFKVTNPELQSALDAARERFAARSEKAGIAAGVQTQAEEKQEQAPEPAIRQTLAIDEGHKIKPADRDRESMLAAMKQASEKWGAIGVNGTEREKAMAVEIAAEYGFELTNPELQEKLAEARHKVEDGRQKEAAKEEKRLGVVEGSNVQMPGQKMDAEINKRTEGGIDDREKREAVRAALEANSARWSPIRFTGAEQDKPIVASVAAEHGFTIVNPEMQEMLAAERERFKREPGRVEPGQPQWSVQRWDAETQTRNTILVTADAALAHQTFRETMDATIVDMRTGRTAALVEWENDGSRPVYTVISPLLQKDLEALGAEKLRSQRNEDNPTLAPSPGQSVKTEAEIGLGLEAVRSRVEKEAVREVRQAEQSSKTVERPFDGGGDDHAYRTKSEASAAKSAERSVEQNPGKAMPADINQSPEIERQRQTQQQLLAEKEANRQAEDQKQTQRNRPRQKQ